MQRGKLRGERPQVGEVFFRGNETIGIGLLFEAEQAINIALIVAVMVAESDRPGDFHF